MRGGGAGLTDELLVLLPLLYWVMTSADIGGATVAGAVSNAVAKAAAGCIALMLLC